MAYEVITIEKEHLQATILDYLMVLIKKDQPDLKEFWIAIDKDREIHYFKTQPTKDKKFCEWIDENKQVWNHLSTLPTMFREFVWTESLVKITID